MDYAMVEGRLRPSTVIARVRQPKLRLNYVFKSQSAASASFQGLGTGPPQQPVHQLPDQQDGATEHSIMQQQQQQQQQRLQHLRQRQNHLLARPSISYVQEQQHQSVEQPATRRRAAVLDDSDTRMAAFDQLTVQVTCPQEVAKPPVAESFNKGPGKMRQIVAANLRAMRINRPTPVQGHMVPAVLRGHDVLAAGPPGAGTSTGALLAVTCRVLSTPRSLRKNKAMPLALIICPSRELAAQLAAEGARLAAGTHLIVKCVTGGAELAQQVIDLRRGADILVCTPGRLMDLLEKKTLSLARVKHLVLEDVDELMGPLLMSSTRQVLHHPTLPDYQRRQTIATGSSALLLQQLLAAAADVLQPSAVVIRAAWQLPNQQEQQQEVISLPAVTAAMPFSQAALASLLANPSAALAASAAAAASAIPPSVTQRFLGVAEQLKVRFLLRLLSAGAGAAGGLVLVFTNSHSTAESIWKQLEAAGISAGVLHYARSQTQRDEALQCFKYGVTQVLVACGIAYRGLDLPDVAQVINYDVALSLAEYARRLGRTGRAGRPGVAVTLVSPSDGSTVASLVAVLRAGGQQVPDWLTSLAGGNSDNNLAAAAAGDGQLGGASASASGSVGDTGLQQSDSRDVEGMPAAGDVSRQEAAAGSYDKGPVASRKSRHQGSTVQKDTMFSVESRGRPQLQFGSYMDQEV